MKLNLQRVTTRINNGCSANFVVQALRLDQYFTIWLPCWSGSADLSCQNLVDPLYRESCVYYFTHSSYREKNGPKSTQNSTSAVQMYRFYQIGPKYIHL